MQSVRRICAQKKRPARQPGVFCSEVSCGLLGSLLLSRSFGRRSLLDESVDGSHILGGRLGASLFGSSLALGRLLGLGFSLLGKLLGALGLLSGLRLALGLALRNALEMIGVLLVPGCEGAAEEAVAKFLVGEKQGDPTLLEIGREEDPDDPMACMHDCAKCAGCGPIEILRQIPAEEAGE